MRRFLTLLALTSLSLAACGGTPAPQDTPGRATVTAVQPAQSTGTPTPTPTATPAEIPEPTGTPTPLPVGTWETMIDGVVYDQSRGSANPIAGASVSYEVLHSYFSGLQRGRPNETVTGDGGEFSLPVMVHDTDSIRVLIEAQGFISFEERLVGVDLFGGKSFDVGLTPLLTATASPP